MNYLIKTNESIEENIKQYIIKTFNDLGIKYNEISNQHIQGELNLSNIDNIKIDCYNNLIRISGTKLYRNDSISKYIEQLLDLVNNININEYTMQTTYMDIVSYDTKTADVVYEYTMIYNEEQKVVYKNDRLRNMIQNFKELDKAIKRVFGDVFGFDAYKRDAKYYLEAYNYVEETGITY